MNLVISQLVHELAKSAIIAYRIEMAWHAFLPDEFEWGWFDPSPMYKSAREIDEWNRADEIEAARLAKAREDKAAKKAAKRETVGAA